MPAIVPATRLDISKLIRVFRIRTPVFATPHFDKLRHNLP